MFPKRFLIIGAVALLILGLFVLPSVQRDAWMQGYLAGQLASQDGGKAAPIAPYLYPGYGGMGYGPHFGGFGALLGFLFLLFLIFGLGRFFMHWAWRNYRDYEGRPGSDQSGEPPAGAAYGRHWRRHGPWWDWDEPLRPEHPAPERPGPERPAEGEQPGGGRA
jgi:hypothetical protein